MRLRVLLTVFLEAGSTVLAHGPALPVAPSPPAVPGLASGWDSTGQKLSN